MCEFCTKHGEGKIWYKQASNYSRDLLSDIRRRSYIKDFLTNAFAEGFAALGRLEAIYTRKGKLPKSVAAALVQKAKEEHFGQVLPIEEIGEIVEKARSIVRMPCACRWNIGKQEARCCYAVSYGAEPWYADIDMSYFGKAPDEGMESVTPAEAIRHMRELEAEGAVHTIWTMMTPFIGAICNCSPEECLAMRTLERTRVETMARAEQVAFVDAERCTGCGLCDARCHFKAIERDFDAGKYTAKITSYACFGCGLCRGACPTNAISLVPRNQEVPPLDSGA